MNSDQERRVRTLLIPALRSGSYQQIQGVLRRTTLGCELRYCCLGVATDVAIPDAWSPNSEFGAVIDPISNVIRSGYLSPAMQHFYGLTADGAFILRVDGAEATMMPTSYDTDWFGPNADAITSAYNLAHHVIKEIKTAFSLTSMNDAGMSFADIADAIEFVLDTPMWSFREPLTNLEGDHDLTFRQIEDAALRRSIDAGFTTEATA